MMNVRKFPEGILLVVLSGIAILFLSFCIFCGGVIYVTSLPIQEEALANWSRDGQRLAYVCFVDGPTENIAEWNGSHYSQEAADICLIDVNGRNHVRLTKDPGGDFNPVWSPSGSQIAYIRQDGVYIVEADGSGKRRLLSVQADGDGLTHIGKVAWSPDGSQLLFSGCMSDYQERDIYLVGVNTGILENLTHSNGRQDVAPKWTLNGTKILFQSTSAQLSPLGTCRPEPYPVAYQLRMINIDGSDELLVYEGEDPTLENFSVSDTGQIAFVGKSPEVVTRDLHLYKMDLNETGPVAVDQVFGPISMAPSGKWLLYDRPDLKILEVDTGEIQNLPSYPITYVESIDTWSPDNQRVAITASKNPTGFYEEKHIYILDLRDGTVCQLVKPLRDAKIFSFLRVVDLTAKNCP